MPVPAVAELSAIPLEHMIGGPMNAIVRAQTMASLATIDYIQAVGLDGDGAVRTVDFKIKKTLPADPNATPPITDPQLVDVTVTAPLLVLAPPPSIRVAQATIAFKAKLTDVQTTDRSISINNKFSADLSFKKVVTIKASSSVQIDAKSTSRREREYSLDVNVTIVQDAIPAGLAKLLDILENAM